MGRFKRKVLREKLTAMTLVGLVTLWTMSGGKYDSGGDVQAGKLIAQNDRYKPSSYTASYENTTETISLESGTYRLKNVNIEAETGQSALKIEDNSTVHIWLEGINSLKGGDGSGMTGGGAGIEVPENATLFLHGDGNLTAIGGKGGDAENGENAGNAVINIESDESGTLKDDTVQGGNGGKGGNGGGGGGAGIGTSGGAGGTGGAGGLGKIAQASNSSELKEEPLAGSSGNPGNSSEKCGKVYLLSTGKVSLSGGESGKIGDGGDGTEAIVQFSFIVGAAVGSGGGGGGGGGAQGGEGKKLGSGGLGGPGGGGGGGGGLKITEPLGGSSALDVLN